MRRPNTRKPVFPLPAHCTTGRSFPEYRHTSLLCRKIPLHCCSPLSNVPHSTSQSSSTKGRISICFCPHQQRILNGLRRPNTRKPVFPLPAHCTTSQSFPEYPPPLSSAGKYPFTAARHSPQHLLKEGLGGTANLYNSKEATSQRNVVSSDILNVGKSTLFNCLTSLNAPVGNYPFYTVEPNVGQVFVPAPRLFFIILVA